jgi:ABC-type bacteriocin/lantibiotic exporter with double-glycine peptidase domain
MSLMPDKPPLHKQETGYSCGPACLKMVLEAFGEVYTEQELRELCDCTYDSVFLLGGADAHPFKVKAAAQKLGFVNTKIANPSFNELKSELEWELYPIVYVKAQLAPDKPLQKHAVVVVEIGENFVEIRDPWRGELVLSEAAFLTEWESARRVTILVEK